ncbi:MAG: glutamine amidotransferase [Eubacteriales bacterium]|nr:glutamine amidotransferase [Eubacteriales bacterium]
MKLTILHLYPDLLNLYGDRGNIQCMAMRCRWRGIEAEVLECCSGDRPDFARADIVLLGGGSDREQQIVCSKLLEIRDDFHAYVEDGGTLLAVCGGYQLLGHYYDTAQGRIRGLSLVDLRTVQGSPRLISNVVLESDDFPYEIVGFENHGGRTFTGAESGLRPLGRVLYGYGNNGRDGMEGILYKNVIGTYLHGPLLPKNPHVCDRLLRTALERRYGAAELSPLDDRQERAANRAIVRRFLNR